MRYTAFCCLAIAGATFALAAMPTPAAGQTRSAADKPATKSRSLDQQLLDDLDRELLKGLPRATMPPDSAPRAGDKGAAPASAGEKRAQTDNRVGDSQNPLANIAQRMRAVERSISQHDT